MGRERKRCRTGLDGGPPLLPEGTLGGGVARPVRATVKLKPGAEITESGLDAFCRGRIATFKIPRYWKFVDSFPMTVTGKVQKYRMREMSIDELGLRKAAAVRTA